MQEPEPLLDAIAANPDDTAAWHVLADWLLENDAPHAVLAAYDLKLRDGTNDPDLLGDYAMARRARHRLPHAGGMSVDTAIWRCGYVTRVTLMPGSGATTNGVRQLLQAPQFSALSRLELDWRGPELSGGFERAIGLVLESAPAVVRRLAISVSENPPGAPITRAQLKPLEAQRPPRATSLELSLKRIADDVLDGLPTLARIGWKTVDLAGTALVPRHVDALLATARASAGSTFDLGGTGLTAAEVAALQLPNVRWVPPAADALLVNERTGAVYPATPDSKELTTGRLTLQRDLGGWLSAAAPPRRRLRDGERLTVGGSSWLFREGHGSELAAWYRELLASIPTG